MKGMKLGTQACALLFAGAAAGLPAPSAAQSAGNWDAVMAAARKEGRVLLYSGAVPAVTDRIKREFEKSVPGIVMEVHREASGPMLAKLEAERNTNADGADLVITTEVLWLDNKQKEGLLRAPVGPAAQPWPAAYLRGPAVPVLSVEPLVITYNTTGIKTPITGYQDFLRPEFKGKFATSTLASVTVIAWYDWLDKALGADFTAKLAAQQPKHYVGTITSTQATASGEVVATVYSNPGAAVPLLEKGAPIRMVFPRPGFGFRYGGGLLAWSKRPNSAQVLMNYMMSPQGQTAWVGPGGIASPLPNIPNSADASALQVFDPSAFPPEVQKAVTEKWNRLFKAN
ncbi:MAG: extracellular solute-binding protein [Betaproteobacteria bacterium]|nr:extracellular solute-binding protein [Betaproteobacteria bacterium]